MMDYTGQINAMLAALRRAYPEERYDICVGIGVWQGQDNVTTWTATVWDNDTDNQIVGQSRDSASDALDDLYQEATNQTQIPARKVTL